MSDPLVLYSRARCGLCDEMLAVARPLASKYSLAIECVDIDEDLELARRYNLSIPLLMLGPVEIARHHAEPAALERALVAALRD